MPDVCRRLGISVIGAAGGPFHDRAADAAIFDAITSTLRPNLPIVSLETTINDPRFARACVDALLAGLGSAAGQALGGAAG